MEISLPEAVEIVETLDEPPTREHKTNMPPALPASSPLEASSLDTTPLQGAAAICRGVVRVMEAHGYACLTEMTLANGRRADVVAVGSRSDILILEIKSGVPDFQSDQKWPDYLDYCDRFFFAVDNAFPSEILPKTTGLVIADAFGGAILRDAPEAKLAGARRRAMLTRFGQLAAHRLSRVTGLTDTTPLR